MKKNSNRSGIRNHNVIPIRPEKPVVDGLMGVYSRNYPSAEVRSRVIARIQSKPDEKRSADEWWQLGEYCVLDGLFDHDDGKINIGISALTIGANKTPPSVACLTDLGWILAHKGLDQMALPYLEQAAEIVDNSRDIWALLALVYMGTGDREKAALSYKRACSLPGATDQDLDSLKEIEGGQDLSAVRRKIVLSKISIQDIASENRRVGESAKIALWYLLPMYEDNPTDQNLAFELSRNYYFCNEFERAESVLHSLLGFNSGFADAIVLLGLINAKRGNLVLAEDYYRKALEVDAAHVLANTNLASLLQDSNKYAEARPLLERAINSADQDNPHLAVALDLLGSNIGVIDQDFNRESEYHRKSVDLDRTRPYSNYNLIVSLCFAGKDKEAKEVLQNLRASRLVLSDHAESVLKVLSAVYMDHGRHPYEYLDAATMFVNDLQLSWPSVLPLLRRAWIKRVVVPVKEKDDFYSNIGMMLGNAGGRADALNVWLEGIGLGFGGVFELNYASELSMLGRHSEAIDAAKKIPMNLPRSWTILGNIQRAAGFYKTAIAAYREAIIHDEKFLLPISNAIDCAVLGNLADDLTPFIQKLEVDWLESREAKGLLGIAFKLKNDLSRAISAFQNALLMDGRILSPDELAEAEESKDLSIFSTPTDQFHYEYGLSLLRKGDFNTLLQLADLIQSWPSWSNGNWSVLKSEALRAAGHNELALRALDTLKSDQPPRWLSLALIHLGLGDNAAAEVLIDQGIACNSSQSYIHPLGRPDSMFLALKANMLIENGDAKSAEIFAKEAVVNDCTCVHARLAYAKTLYILNDKTLSREILYEGLLRVPADPDLFQALMTGLVEDAELEKSEVCLDRYRHLLTSNGSSELAYRFGELVSLAKLAKRQAEGSLSLPGHDAELPWSKKLPNPIREWVQAARLAKSGGEKLQVAYAMYLCKITESLLITQVFETLRISCGANVLFDSDRHKDIARYLGGGVPPSIGAMVRLLSDTEKAYRSSEDLMVTTLRDLINSGVVGQASILRNKGFINRLSELARLRNNISHTGDSDANSDDDTLRLVLDGDVPGDIFSIGSVSFI